MNVIRDRLCLEGFRCVRHLGSVEDVYTFLEALSYAAGMRVLVPPVVVRVPVVNAAAQIETKTDWGISGSIIWLESGAMIHTWPEEGFAALDMFSCKAFNHDVVEDLFRKMFSPARVDRMESVRLGDDSD